MFSVKSKFPFGCNIGSHISIENNYFVDIVYSASDRLHSLVPGIDH